MKWILWVARARCSRRLSPICLSGPFRSGPSRGMLLLRPVTAARTQRTKDSPTLTSSRLATEAGPEHIVLARDGKLYVAVASGRVLRMNPDGSAQEVFAETGGRVLGFDFDRGGQPYRGGRHQGPARHRPGRRITLLTDQVGGDPIRYADAVVVARTGNVYFTDASGRFSPARWGGTFEAAVLDILEQAATGRVLEYDPASKTTRVVAKGFSFANGLALSRDERTLFVAETGRFRVWKIDPAAADLDVGQPSPEATVLLDNLPGYPDNLMRGSGRPDLVGLHGPTQPKGRRHIRQTVPARSDAAPAADALAITEEVRACLRLYGGRYSRGRSAGPVRKLPADHRCHGNRGSAVRAEPASSFHRLAGALTSNCCHSSTR